MLEKLNAKLNKKILLALAVVFLLAAGSFFYLCNAASHRAAELFNQQMSRQQILRGTVTADTISADIWGNVSFTQLNWLDDGGEPVLLVSAGTIKISPWDVITNNISEASIKQITLDSPHICIDFDEKMRWDILAPKAHKKQFAEGTLPSQTNSRSTQNINLPEQVPNIELVLSQAELAVTHKKRLFVLNDVNARAKLRGDDLRLSFKAGKFGGSIRGDGLSLEGKVNLSGQQPLRMNLGLYEVLPSSLGLGKVNDLMTITGEVKGNLREPLIDGAVAMKQLDLPPLLFHKVNGNFHYENGLITFEDVTASVYGGTVEAIGLYHFDNRHYKISAKGKDLLASAAAKSNKISCNVDLDFNISSLGKASTALTYGSFKSGRGSYMFLPFNGIEGRFSDQYRELSFRDVMVHTDLGTFETNAFKIVKGKVILGDIFMVAEDGERLQIK